jgi:hypothetical protein
MEMYLSKELVDALWAAELIQGVLSYPVLEALLRRVCLLLDDVAARATGWLS